MAQTQVQPEIQPTTPILNGESPEQKRVRGRPPGTGSRQQQEAERIQHEAAQREALADPFVTLLPKSIGEPISLTSTDWVRSPIAPDQAARSMS